MNVSNGNIFGGSSGLVLVEAEHFSLAGGSLINASNAADLSFPQPDSVTISADTIERVTGRTAVI